ncbi:MAG: MBL fold metallo-hydrolase [Robiginitomaculum sp.]|nr:MAG: MBL fold metallo-hydrolase [Robiginitomaculum sp.]
MGIVPKITAFFDETTFTVSYVISDPGTGKAALLDTVLDFDANSGCTSTKSAEALLAYLEAEKLSAEWILETHAHADHLSAAHYLKEKLGAKVCIGRGITQVQQVFAGIFNLGEGFACDGTQFDHLFEDGQTIALGDLRIHIMATPGHTPGCITYCVGKNAFVGDTLFMPDFGTARTDFPGGDAKTLYHSIRRILALPEETTLYMCHDYKAPGRDDFAWVTSVAEQREKNVHIHDGITMDEFVAMRTAKDKTLCVPRLILPAIQINIRAGAMPEAEDNGRSYLKLPLNTI